MFGIINQDNFANLNLVITQAITKFVSECKKPAIWCYGNHTKMLMADFMFELKKIKCIIDNGMDSNKEQGFEIINEKQILEKGIDGIIISSRIYKNEIIDNIEENYKGVKYLDIYQELEKAGMNIEGNYYESKLAEHPYVKYRSINTMQIQLFNGTSDQEKILKKIIKKYIEIKDFLSAIKYADKLKRSNEKDQILKNLHEIYDLEIESLRSINENNVLMLCIDGLRRKDVCEERVKNLHDFLERDTYYFSNAYSASTSTYESLLSAYSENDDLKTKYYENNMIVSDNCRFIKEAKKQERNIFFYTDGTEYIDDDMIKVTSYSQTATEKIWSFLVDSINEKNGLFYIHLLYESHYSYPNPYTSEELEIKGSYILFDYLDKNGGQIKKDYIRQQKDALLYIDDIVIPLIECIPCRMVLYADHGNILIPRGGSLKDIERTKFTFHEDIIQVPLAVKSPETVSGVNKNLTSIQELNSIIIALMKQEKVIIRENNFVKVMRSEIYNPEVRCVYKMAKHDHELLAFEVFIFEEYKLAIYSDGAVELYLKRTDHIINNFDLKMELLNTIMNKITVCDLEQIQIKE